MIAAKPIKDRDYLIALADDNPTPFRYVYVHQDYDGEGDTRHGVAVTIEDAKLEIDIAIEGAA
jgi:hypothetical protein